MQTYIHIVSQKWIVEELPLSKYRMLHAVMDTGFFQGGSRISGIQGKIGEKYSGPSLKKKKTIWGTGDKKNYPEVIMALFFGTIRFPLRINSHFRCLFFSTKVEV